MYKKTIKKLLHLFLCFSMLFQSFAPAYVYAEDISPTPTPEVTTTPTPEVTPSPEPTVTPTPEVTPTSTPEITVTPTTTPELTPTATVTPTPTETLTPAPEDTPTPEVTPDSTDSALPVDPTIIPTPVPTPTVIAQAVQDQNVSDQNSVTFTNVIVNTSYKYKDTNVSVTFTKLPVNAGSLSIKEIKLTPEQIAQTGAVSDTAYDITSSMENGTFEYDLTLPIPSDSQNKELTVKSTESESTINTASVVTEKKEIKSDIVTIKGLNHFTLFVVSKVVDPTVIYVNNLQPNWDNNVYAAYYYPDSDTGTPVSPGNTQVYDGRESAIIKAGITPKSGSSYKDEGLLAFKVPNVDVSSFASHVLSFDVENETGSNPVWVRIRLTDANQTEYQFVPETNPSGWHTVNAATGQWQKMNNNGDATGTKKTLSEVASDNPGLSVDRVYLTLGIGNSYNGTGSGTIGWVDKVTIDNLTYDFVIKDTCVGASVTPPSGTTACYSTIKEALDAAVDGDTINISEGTYNLTSQLNINKPVSIVGLGTVVLKSSTNYGSANGSKHLLTVYSGTQSNPVNITNITFDANGNSYGVNTYGNAYVNLDNVNILNSRGGGITVNGSTVNANELNTSGNSWYGVNVDPGSGVTTPSIFTIDSGELSEKYQIYSDGSHVTDSATVSVTATGYQKYSLGGTINIWTNRPLENVATITRGSVTTIYSTIKLAIDAAIPGDTIMVSKGTFEESPTVDLSDIKIIGVGSDINKDHTTLKGTFYFQSGEDNITITGFYQTPVWDSLNGHNLIQSGISISNSANSTISNNSFNYNPSSAFDLLGALTGTKIQFNDISIDSMDYYGNDKLFVSAAADGAFSLPFNYWGSGNSPDLSKVSSVNSVSLNRWLVAPKDTGIPNESGYHYTSNDGNIHITGGSGSTAKLYVGQYDPDSSDVETPSLPSTLIALSPYYDIVSDNDSNDGISFPLNVEINYTHQEGINTKGIYYYDTETSSWLAYSEPTISDLSISVLAPPHLTKMVVAGEAEPTDVKAPLVSITNPTASMLKGSIDIRGSVVDDNPDHYYLVVNNSASKTIAGPGTVIQTDSFTDQSLFNWDTTKFSDGVYTIRLEARDKFGNKDTGSVSVRQVIVDNSGPETPTNLTPSNGVWRHTSNSNKTTWSPVTDTNGPVTYYYESSVSNNVNADGSFVNKAYSSTALSVPEIYNPGEPEVTYYWHVKACDSVGNCSPWSDAWTINIDNGKPAVSVSNPTTGSYLKNPVSISGSVSDARSGVASVSYHIYKVNPDGSTTLQNGCTSLTSVINGNNWNSAVINNGGSCNLLDGNYEIAAWAYDNAGNPGWASRVRFFLDNTAPASPLITYPATNDLYFKTSPILNQWSIVTDISGIDHYRIEYKYDDGHTFSGFPYRIETNNWRNHVPALNEQGGVSFRVQAFDKAGNEGSWSDWRHYTYDATPPTSPGVPATSSYITSLTTQDWSWTSSSDSISGINQYLYRVLNLGTNTQSDWSSTGLVLGTSTNLNEGQWQLDVKSQDNAGNESTVVSSQTLIVDTTPPTTSANNSSSSWKKNSFKITLSVGDTGNSNIKTSKYNWDSAADSVTGTSFANQQQINPLQGVHTLYLYAEDNAGNTTTWSGVYKYDSQKPSVPTISTPLNNGYINSSSIQTIGWTQATDPTPGSNISTANGYHYQISTKLNFSTTERDYSVGSLSWTLTNPLADGVYYLRVQSKDNAGNYSNWSNVVRFIVDTQAPSLQSQTHFGGWYNQNQTSTFEYFDTNGVVSGTSVSCLISTEGENQTCSVTPNVCDAAGNCNTQTVTSNGANIDKTLPTSAITTPSNQGSDSTIFTNSWTGNILGTATDSLSGLSKVQITIQNSHEQYWNGESWQAEEYLLNTQATDESFDTWQYTGLQNPTPDSYTIVSHATDNAGNFENSYKLTVVLDKTIPQVSLSIDPATPDAQNDWYKTQPTVTLSATDTNFDKIEYQWDNQNGSWTTYVNPFTPDSQGAHTLYYRALDKAGNVSDVGIKNISWDNTDLKDGPLNMWVSPNPTSGDTALVKWEAASDNVGIAKYEIRWSLVGSSTSYTDTVGQEIREHTINNLTEGKWNVNVKAIDAAGNWKDSNADLIVDRTSPNAPTLSLAGQGNGSATLSWTKVDDAVDYIIWYGNQPGQHLFGARVGNTTNFTVLGLGAGNYYFSVKSVDQAQNQSGFSNEVNTGNIAGAPGVNPGTPAQGFTPEVKGTSTEATPSGTVITVTPSTTPQVLGMDSNRNIKDYWWLLLLIPFTLLWRLLSKKLKSSMP